MGFDIKYNSFISGSGAACQVGEKKHAFEQRTSNDRQIKARSAGIFQE
jgi:hypothetical protein